MIALVSYSIVAPLISLATRDIPADVATFIANGTFLGVVFVVIVFTEQNITEYLTHSKSIYLYVAGVLIAVSILTFYRALELGPVSVVTPIYGLFIVGSAALGIVFLDESLTARKAAGIAFAVLAIYLTSVE
jgi:transporter family protein